MNFLLGVLVITLAFLTVRMLIRATARVWRRASRFIREGRRSAPHQPPVLCQANGKMMEPVHREIDWEALSKAIRQELRARGVRSPSRTRRAAQLAEAIEIEKLEIELVRLKAEKAQTKTRSRGAPATRAGEHHGRRAANTPSSVPLAELQAMRDATRGGSVKPHARTPPPPVRH